MSDSQNIKDLKKQTMFELLRTAIDIDGEHFVKYSTAIRFVNKSFTDGFKTARRDRTALSDHLICEMEKRFIIKSKD